MRPLTLGRFALSTGDFAIVLALVAIVLALVAPTFRARSFRAHVEDAVGDVETLRGGAERFRQAQGAWPAPGEPGVVPSELVGSLPDDADFTRDRYALAWGRWDVVDMVEAPPSLDPPPADAPPDSVGPILIPAVRTIGGVVVHSSDESLLAELLDRYGAGRSFVRDTTWTLLLPERSGAP